MQSLLKGYHEYPSAGFERIDARGRLGGHPAVVSVTSLLDYAACDPRSRVSVGIGFVVIGILVYDKGSATWVEQGVRSVAERDERREQRNFCVPIKSRYEIRQIAGVGTGRIVATVLFAVWVEMRPRGLKVGSFTFPGGIDVNCVGPRNLLHDVQLDSYAVVRL
jgi:hypothetical protein